MPDERLKSGAPARHADVSRRDIAGLVLGALGVATVTGCATRAEATSELATRGAAALSGASFLWSDTMAELRAVNGSDASATSQPVIVLGGYHAIADGGGGVFYWDASSSEADNGGTVIAPSGSLSGRWKRLFSGAINVKWFGAYGDGNNPDDRAIQAAINALPDGGGRIYVPASSLPYIMQASISPQSKPVIVEGDGWNTLSGDGFGTSWANSSVTGSVLRWTNATDGIVVNDAAYRNLVLSNIAFVGPGTGDTAGIDLGLGAQNNQIEIRNVLVANFSRGVSFSNSIDNSIYNLFVKGCGVGVIFRTTDNMRFFDINVQSCAVGIDLAGGTQKFFGGLVQANAIGVKIAPPVGMGCENVAFDGVWFENNAANISMDPSASFINDLSFNNCHWSDNWTWNVNVSGRFAIRDARFPGTIKLVAGSDFLLENMTIGALDTTNVAGGAARITRINVNGVNSSSDVGTALSSAASITPDYLAGEVQQILLSNNATINAPSGAPVNARMTFLIRQDGVGGRALSWGAGYHVSWSDSGNSAFRYTSVSFYCVAPGQWVQTCPQTPYTS